MSLPLSKEEKMRAKVMEAAQQLFQQHGLLKVTMEDVAQAIGKGKSTLYYYYKSKEEIFEAMIDLEITQVLRHIQLAVDQSITATAQLEAFYTTKTQQVQRRLTLYRTLSRDIRQQGEFLSQIHQKYSQREIAILKHILEHGLETGEFNALAGQELDIVAHALATSTHGLEQEMLYEQASDVSQAAGKMLLRLLIAGMKR
jgi:AcrR family transcriptional regulator